MKIKKKQISKTYSSIYSIKFINDNNFKFEFLNLGCYIKSVKIPYTNSNKSEDVILGYKKLKDIKNNVSYFNTIIGRVAGRISNSFFKIDRKKYILFNNNKKHHLHGGLNGFNKKIWKIVKIEKKYNFVSCTMVYNSPHLEEGYPGNLKCYVKYSLNNQNQIIIDFKAKTDRRTLVNLTNHNYWNFNGHNKFYNNIENHKILINSKKYCEVNKHLLPTGKILNVNKTKFDFRKFKKINKKILYNKGIDNFFISANKEIKIQKIAEIYSPLTKMGMELFSDQPGIQFYTGNNMLKKYKGKKRRSYGKNFGLCLEPQNYPNSINTKNFPKKILNKNKIYKSKTIFCLKNNY